MTCDEGTQEQSRACSDPAPERNGEPCAGNSTNTRPCSGPPCPDPPCKYVMHQYKDMILLSRLQHRMNGHLGQPGQHAVHHVERRESKQGADLAKFNQVQHVREMTKKLFPAVEPHVQVNNN